MKISEIKSGTKILVPCPDCGVKRSIIFKGLAEYKKTKLRTCNTCAAENRITTGGVISTDIILSKKVSKTRWGNVVDGFNQRSDS